MYLKVELHKFYSGNSENSFGYETAISDFVNQNGISAEEFYNKPNNSHLSSSKSPFCKHCLYREQWVNQFMEAGRTFLRKPSKASGGQMWLKGSDVFRKSNKTPFRYLMCYRETHMELN